MNSTTPILLAGLAAISLAACEPTVTDDPYYHTRSGAVAGAVLGGVLGASSGGDERLTKGLAGAALGGIAGAAIGSELDKQAQELRRDLNSDGTSVTRNGDTLVVTMPQDILFATDSAKVDPGLQGDLYTLAGSLNRYPDSTLQIIGHTDNTGDANYNQHLSEERADSVAQVLIRSGVPASRITTTGRGEEQPIATNLTPEGRAKNRRVQFIITPTSH